MGIAVQPNVYGLFAAAIPQAARLQLDALPVRKRQGLVPDFLFTLQWNNAGPPRRLLFELKTLHWGSSTYPRSASERCHAVARRALQLPGEYATKAHRTDVSYCGTPVGDVGQGPVAQRLRTFDPVHGLVFGSWGEASPDVHRLLSSLAAAGAQRHYRRMGAQSPEDARGALAWLLKRRWAITAVRENARLILTRLEMVGRGADAAADRRRVQADSEAARARHVSCWQRHGSSLATGR